MATLPLSYVPIVPSMHVYLNGAELHRSLWTYNSALNAVVTSEAVTADLLECKYAHQGDVVSEAMPLDMLVWLKADFATPDGTIETVWPDVSGNDNHASPDTGGTGAAYYANQTPAGTGALRFGGADGQIRYKLPNIMTGLAAGEMFVVLKANAEVNNPGMWHFGSHGGAQAPHYPKDGAGGPIWDGFGATNIQATSDPAQNLATWHLYNVMSKTGEWSVWINSTQIYTTAGHTVGWNTVPKIGFYGTGGAPSTYVWDGDMAEVIVYGRELTSGERAAVTSYLMERHGL